VLQEHFEPLEALRLIEQNRVSVIHIVPSQVAELEEALKEHPADLSSIRILPRGSLEDHLDLPRDHPYAAACLGLTEMLTLASSIPWDSPLEVRDTTHGLPLPGTLIKIIDPQTGETLPVGEHGEIALKGTTLMKGYNKVFPETYLDGAGYYRTKDAGYFDEDGYLHWTGRMSQLIRTNAANVSPGEVEAAIFETFDVKIAAVVGVPHPELGEMVVACVVPKPGVVLAEDEVRAALKGRLASYKIPGRVFFFEESEVELTGSGKVVLSTLKSLVAARMESTEGGEGS
jgi:fatty-acyl-CoA synthase